MTYHDVLTARSFGAALAFAGFSLLAAGGALAQTAPGKAAPKAAAPAAAAPAAAAPAAAGQQSAWVKLCEKAKLQFPGKDGKPEISEKNICLTHHERLDGNSGMVIVSAALRQVDGADKQHLMVMVPLGMAIPPGLKAAVYNKDQWDKAAKNEKFDEKTLKPVDLKYTLCHPAGCTAEMEATKELIDAMKTGGGIMVFAWNGAAQPIAFPVPLDGFTTAQSGAPVDNKVYGEARGKLMMQIRARQEEVMKQYQEQQKATAAAPAAAAPAAPAAKKP